MSLPLRSTTWSPVDCIPGAKLTESGLLELLPGEVVLWDHADLIELRAAVPDEALSALTFGGNLANTSGKTWVDRSLDYQLTITTHRIVFQKNTSTTTTTNTEEHHGDESKSTSQRNQARFLHLSNLIADTQLEKGSLFKSARILLYTILGELYVIFRGDKSTAHAKDVLQHLETAVRRKEWETEYKLQQMEKATVALSSDKVGVDAILSRSAARQEQATNVATQAFAGDAETLMEEAAALIKIIEKYVTTLDKHENDDDDNGNDNNASSSLEDNKRLTDLLQNMGMTAALRKADYKGREDAYYSQLARQLADFLRPKIKNTMMTLTDVYCLYNRARGSNLISPEDLLQAINQMERLQLGLSHHIFPSGLRVLQDASLNQDKMAELLQDLATTTMSQKNAGISQVEVSRQLHVSVLLAQEQLLAAERLGSLVRDETTESIRFFPNRFVEWCE